jgi:hypothetical protein
MANTIKLKSIAATKIISLTKKPALSLKPIRGVPLSLPVVSITPLGENSVVTASASTRPLWFNGRFLAAQDLQRDQDSFLSRQAAIGQSAAGVIHGLHVNRAISGSEPDAETLIITAGQGITPGGFLVMFASDLTVRLSDIAEEEDLDLQFGASETPQPMMRTRSGLYVIALRPAQFTANPITSYPSEIQGNSQTQDGNVVEATAVSLVPYPIPAANYDTISQNAAAARQVFVENNSGNVSDSLLPVAMISVERNEVQWVDEWMVRRESGPEPNPLRIGLIDIAAEQAFLRQFDAQLEQIVDPMLKASKLPRFAAANYFQALPAAGRIPLASIDPKALTQFFFPAQATVTLSLIPQDELSAVIDDSMSLPPIDLTLTAAEFADLAFLILVPVARGDYGKFAAALQPVDLAGGVPPAFSLRTRSDLLRLFRVAAPPPSSGDPPPLSWQDAIGTQTYGYFVRRRSAPAYVSFALANTSTTLAVAPVAGSPSTQYTATVTPPGTGTVTFMDKTTEIGTNDINNGLAILVLPNLAAGAHSLTAVYNGDVNYASSTSPAVALTI